MPFKALFSYSLNGEIIYENCGWSVPPPYTPMKITHIKRPAQCMAFSEENLWKIGNSSDPESHPKRPGDGNKIYSAVALNDNYLWLAANKQSRDYGCDNIATYHNVSSAKRDLGKANICYVDGHVGLVKGLAGYDAYFEYGRPYPGHENIALW